MAKESDHQSDTDDKKESCSVKPVEGGGDCSNQGDQPQPATLCNNGCPCKLAES